MNYNDPEGLSPKDVDLIRNLFTQNIKDMVKDDRRLAGRGDTNNNNEIVDRCNVNAMSLSFNNFLLNNTPFGTACTEADKKLEYCEGQSTILNNVLNTALATGRFEDIWKFQVQSGPGHFWLVGISSNDKDPILWMDSWKEEFSIGKTFKFFLHLI